MKLSKKLTTLVLAAGLVLGTSVTAFAAPNDEVISALKAAKVPETYVIQAENYLKTNTLTEAQATAVKTQVTKVADILKAANVTDVTKLSNAQKSQVLSAVSSAGSSVGLTITTTKQSNGALAIVATNSAGTEVLSFTSKEVKQTGANSTVLVAGAFVLVLAAGSVFVVKKAGSSEAVEA